MLARALAAVKELIASGALDAAVVAGIGKLGHQMAAAGQGSANGERAGKGFTAKGKREVIETNKKAHSGKTICEGCGVETVPAERGQRGVSPPRNETHVDHVIPRSKGGDGAPSNGQVLCRDCNLGKSDEAP